MRRTDAIETVLSYFDDGQFITDLARRIAYETESQERRSDQLRAYLDEEVAPALARMQFKVRCVANPVESASPFLIAERWESDDVPTVLMYGHGDVVRGQARDWTKGNGPWRLSVDADRIYGRGAADNKGQHTINLAALEIVLKARNGVLGFNVKYLMEMGEELGSPGLREVALAEQDSLRADVFIASDGPRLRMDTPMLFLGSRGVLNFTLRLRSRQGAHHSGNWGGLLANPAVVLVNALASLVDRRGRILLDALRSPALAPAVREALSDCDVTEGPEDGAAIDRDWGEPDCTPAERVFASNTLEILALEAGNPAKPVNAIPAAAVAHCQMRFIAGTDWREFAPSIRRHLQANGFEAVEVEVRDTPMTATMLSPDHPWVAWAANSIQSTTGIKPTIVPSTGGSLPNDVFSELLGLPTIWIPHSYGGCSQHAPNEHLMSSVAREALAIMAGLFWDLGEGQTPPMQRRAA